MLLIMVAIPLDILDAATYECLPGYVPTVPAWTFKRTALSSRRVVYELTQQIPGDLGYVRLQFRSRRRTAILIREPDGESSQQKQMHDFIIKAFWDRLRHDAIWRANSIEPPLMMI